MTPEEQIDATVRDVLEQFGADMAADIQDEVSSAYPPASAPGTPPHQRTGYLRSEVQHVVIQNGPATELHVISAVPYSGFLEGGTGRMAARPFMGPAAEKWTPVVFQRLSEAFASQAAPSVAPVVELGLAGGGSGRRTKQKKQKKSESVVSRLYRLRAKYHGSRNG